VGSGSAPIGTPVVRQVDELDQWVGPHVARGPTSVLIHSVRAAGKTTDPSREDRGSPKNFGSGNHSTDSRTLDQITRDKNTQMSAEYAAYDASLSEQWRRR
jgi:hypothetical protein